MLTEALSIILAAVIFIAIRYFIKRAARKFTGNGGAVKSIEDEK